jgi:hypothetical protein
MAAMTSGLSDAVLDETEADLISSRSYQASKGEQRLNLFGALLFDM